jgi:hypothetical protein
MSTNDATPQPGDLVILTRIPPGLLKGLPCEDQHAIADVIGKPVLLSEYDDTGRAELEFIDEEGIIHYIYVDVDDIRRVDSK